MLRGVFKNSILFFGIAIFCRLFFYIYNLKFFPEIDPSVFFYGLRFDLISIGYLFSGFFLIQFFFQGALFPRLKKVLQMVFFQIGLNAMLLTNLIDTVYYNFTFKRTTSDVFALANTGNELGRLVPKFLSDFWFVVLVYVLAVIGFTKLFLIVNRGREAEYLYSKWKLVKQFFKLAVGVFLVIIAARGGTQLRPINIADAPRYAKGNEIAVLLNTPFSLMLTLDKQENKLINYPDNPLVYNPIQTIVGSGKEKGSNVVLIILESFGEEYVGKISGKDSYTPFLDSLVDHSFVFKNHRSNGFKSIEALPSLFSGIPSLYNTPFSLSSFSANKIESLASVLDKFGYNSSFYHGGETGTMSFDAFCRNAGIQEYFGQEDYPTPEKDFDGYWGVYDGPYFQYYANELDKKQEPFFSSIFSLSSHHPFSVPKEHEGKYPTGVLTIYETIGYTDNALKEFFKTASKKKWFENTLFVITADHPAHSKYDYYIKNSGRSKVPLIFYKPNSDFKGESYKLAKHSDVPSTVLGLVTDSVKVLNFGHDLFDDEPGFCVNFKDNMYIVRKNNFVLLFDGLKTRGFYEAADSLWTNDLKEDLNYKLQLDSVLNFGKAYFQDYNNRLIENKLVVD